MITAKNLSQASNADRQPEISESVLNHRDASNHRHRVGLFNDADEVIEGNLNSQMTVNKIKITRKDDWFAFIVFLLIGTTSMIGWNSLLNMLTALLEVIYHGQGTFTDTMTATYFTVVCIVTLSSSRINVAHSWILFLGLASMGILCLVLAFICTFVPASAASPVLHVFGGFMGFTVGIIVSSAFGIASLLPKLYVGAVASGMGFAGLITFSIWMLSSHAIFYYDIVGVSTSIWILLGFSCCISFLSLVLFLVLMKTRWIVEFFEEQISLSSFKRKSITQFSRKIDDPEVDGADDNVVMDDPKCYERLGFWGVVWEVSGNVTARFFIFFETLIVFPSIGPVGWKDSPVIADISMVGLRYNMGTFQFSDFIGRYLPNVIPFLLIKESNLFWFIILRVILVISFILSMKFPSVIILGDAWFHIVQMGFLAFTNGWLSTVATVHLPLHVNGPAARSRASALGIAMGFVGIVTGQWTSKLLKVILN